MSHWRSGTFWASAIFAWFCTIIFLACLIRFLDPAELTTAEGIIVLLAQQALALAAGYYYGRHQFEIRKPLQVGFPVIMKDDDASTPP